MAAGPAGEFSLRGPIAISLALHLVALAFFFVVRTPSAPPRPPTYRVSLVAAPPGPRAVGVVQPAAPAPTTSAVPAPATPAKTAAPTPAKAAAARTAAPTAANVPPKGKAPAKGKAAPKMATPSVGAGKPASSAAPSAPAPRAGGGPTGGKGADVANVNTAGTAFPYPGYLENVVRQIALRFSPPSRGALRATVAFLIRRDGSVTGIRITERSGVYSFDTEAMGAVDAAAQARAFGPLPQGFADDVLPVIFSFDPRLIR